MQAPGPSSESPGVLDDAVPVAPPKETDRQPSPGSFALPSRTQTPLHVPHHAPQASVRLTPPPQPLPKPSPLSLPLPPASVSPVQTVSPDPLSTALPIPSFPSLSFEDMARLMSSMHASGDMSLQHLSAGSPTAGFPLRAGAHDGLPGLHHAQPGSPVNASMFNSRLPSLSVPPDRSALRTANWTAQVLVFSMPVYRPLVKLHDCRDPCCVMPWLQSALDWTACLLDRSAQLLSMTNE